MAVLKQLYFAFLCLSFLAAPAYSTNNSEEDEDTLASSVSFEDQEESDSCGGDYTGNDIVGAVAELTANFEKIKTVQPLVFESNDLIAIAQEVSQASPEEKALRQLVNKGDLGAMCSLARLLEARFKESKSVLDSMEAMSLYAAAGRKGHLPSMLQISNCYVDGILCEKKPGKALRWIKRAVKAGNREIDRLQLASFLLDGIGCPGDESNKAEALKIFKTLALQGSIVGCEQYASMLDGGIGCEGNAKDQVEATIWYRIGAAQKSEACMYGLATRLLLGKGCEVGEASFREALPLFESLAEKGDSNARSITGYMRLYGFGCEATPDVVASGLTILEKLAADGHNHSKLVLGSYFLRDWRPGRHELDYYRAFELLTDAADSGIAEALYAKGFCLLEGIGCRDRFEEKVDAHIAFSEAALKGYEVATDNLVYCLLFGIGCEDDAEAKKQAFGLLTVGRLEASPFREYCLGYMYATGLGVSPDFNKAMKHLKPYEFADGICPLILYMHLVQKDYGRALAFYERAIESKASLIEHSRLVEYLKFMIRKQTANPSPAKKGNKKSGKKGQVEDEFSEQSIKRDLEETLRMFVCLRDYLSLNEKLMQNISQAAGQFGKRVKAYEFYGAAMKSRALLDRICGEMEDFSKSFKSAGDNAFRRVEINAYLAQLSAVQDEVFISGLEKEFSVIQEQLLSLLRFQFTHGQRKLIMGSAINK